MPICVRVQNTAIVTTRTYTSGLYIFCYLHYTASYSYEYAPSPDVYCQCIRILFGNFSVLVFFYILRPAAYVRHVIRACCFFSTDGGAFTTTTYLPLLARAYIRGKTHDEASALLQRYNIRRAAV